MDKLIRQAGSQSQAGQESFVLNMTGWKKDGYYVEIGAFDPWKDSNTFNLETEYNWKGFGVEILPECVENFKTRNNPCIAADAMTLNYSELFKTYNAPKQIDYLQLDVEPAENTLKVLQAMPLGEYRFSVITFEHDLYDNNWPDNHKHKNTAKNILESYGYKLVAENINHGENKPFEDWYIDPIVINESIWSLAVCNNIDGNSLFE